MTTKRFPIVFASVLILALVLSACSLNIPALGISIDGTPVPALRIDINPATAATTEATIDPLAATPDCSSTPCATPTATATICPTTGVNCPVAQFLGASSTNSLDFKAGKTYHVNVSVTGATAGIETNMMFTALKDFTMVFDGSAWEYPTPITDGSCQLCAETAGDNWVENAPKLQGLVEYHTPPCNSQPTIAWNDSILLKKVTLSSTAVLSTPNALATITNGVIAQGGDGTTTISGICPTGAYCELTYWIPGETGIQHKLVILANTDVVVAGFRGTLVSLDHQPSAQEVGLDASNLSATVANAMAARITFSGDFSEISTK